MRKTSIQSASQGLYITAQPKVFKDTIHGMLFTKYGFLNLCFDKDLRIANRTHRDVFKWASENGFDGVEIYLPTLPELSWHTIQEVKKALTDHSL